jgi:hypothetical protein
MAIALPVLGTDWRRIAIRASLAALLIGFLLFQLGHLGGFAWDFDEGVEMSKAWLMLDGYRLYSDIWASHPPGHTLLIALAFRLFGVSVVAARTVTVIFALLGLIAVVWCVRELDGGWLGGLAAAASLGVAPNFFWASRAAMNGLIHFVLATQAMGFALTAHRTARSRHAGWWAAAAGITFGCALLVKLQMIYLAPLLALLALPWTLLPDRARPGFGRSLGLAVGTLIPLTATVLVYDARAMFDQVVVTYLETRSAYQVDLAANLDKLFVYLTADNLGLTLLATYGLASALARRSMRRLVAVAWLALTVLTAMQHAPLWLQDHFLPLLLVMSIFAGVGIGDLAYRLRQLRPGPVEGHHPSRRQLAWTVLGGAAVLSYVLSFNRVLQTDSMLLSARSYSNDGSLRLPQAHDPETAARRQQRFEEAVAYLQANSAPNDWIITDYEVLAFWARRRVPPELGEVSTRRIDIGRLDAPTLMRVVEKYKPPVILVWADQLDSFDNFMDWSSTRYEPSAAFGQASAHRQAYQLKHIPLKPENPQSVRLGENVTLLGHTAPDSVRAGDTLPVTLYWRAERAMEIDYSVFNHLVDAAGELRAQRDGPAGGQYPTSRWVPGVTIVDHYVIPIGRDVPPGNYTLRTGMYELTTLQRLPVNDPLTDPSGQNAVDLAHIRVIRPRVVN